MLHIDVLFSPEITTNEFERSELVINISVYTSTYTETWLSPRN